MAGDEHSPPLIIKLIDHSSSIIVHHLFNHNTSLIDPHSSNRQDGVSGGMPPFYTKHENNTPKELHTQIQTLNKAIEKHTFCKNDL